MAQTSVEAISHQIEAAQDEAISMEYIRISPFKFQTTLEMKMYKYALNQWYMRFSVEVNCLLMEAEVRPLTNLVDGFDENGWKVAN